jgi:hypothetical protein
MSSVTIDEIKRQEEDIFKEECRGTSLGEMVNKAGGQLARVKALQQLAVSEDSPFNLTGPARLQPVGQVNCRLAGEQQQLRDEKARLLREETEEIKKQLELVKGYLNELNIAGAGNHGDGSRDLQDSTAIADRRHDKGISVDDSEPDDRNVQCVCRHECQRKQANIVEARESKRPQTTTTATTTTNTCNTRRPIHDFVNDQQITSADSQFHRLPAQRVGQTTAAAADGFCNTNTNADPNKAAASDKTRFRPLTGKTDCPNCACDRRRSVCDKCISLQKDVVHQASDQQQAVCSTSLRQMNEPRRQASSLTDEKLSKFNCATSAPSVEHQQQQTNKHVDYDERPIRPAKKRLEEVLDEVDSRPRPVISDETSAKVVDQTVVPGTLYTIGKSLNDKRTMLAQAIESLQLELERVKKRGDRLEQERKVAQLYRDQWKPGPMNNRSCSRESLKGAAGQYQSRLDPNLARDSKAMMGFQHVEPTLKHRNQSGASRSSYQLNVRSMPPSSSSMMPPKPMPRLSKMSANSRRLVVTGSNNYQRATQASRLHSRSKSLESLPRQRSTLSSLKQQQPKPAPPAGKSPSSVSAANQQAKANFHNGKSSSELNLSSSLPRPEPADSPSDQGVEEDLEEDIREDELDSIKTASGRDTPENDGSSPIVVDEGRLADNKTTSLKQDEGVSRDDTRRPTSRPLPAAPSTSTDHEIGKGNRAGSPPIGQQAGKFSGWVPVFGETEIKTINKRPAERKVIILNGSRVRGGAGYQATRQVATSSRPIVGRSILRTSANGQPRPSARVAIAGKTMLTRTGNDRVLNEAEKKLQLAKNLLAREHIESSTKNQIVVNTHRRPVTGGRASTSRDVPPSREATSGLAGVQPDGQKRNSDQQQHRNPPHHDQQQQQQQTSSNWTEFNGDGGSATTNSQAQNLILSANKEISRLEAMISEQQKLLLKLTTSSNGDAAAPTCCQHHASCQTAAGPSKASTSQQQSGTCGGAARHSSGRQLINQLRERLNKTKARLAKTLEEERAKHQQLEQRFDSSLRKQSDLENENELLKQSLSKCIDTCLRDISSTFESLSAHLGDTADGIEAASSGGGTDSGPTIQVAPSPTGSLVTAGSTSGTNTGGGSETPLLINAAQLIADNGHLRRMRLHVDANERQRRRILEELSQEKQRSEQLELQLRQSKFELEQLVDAKRRLEAQLAASAGGSTVTTTTTMTRLQHQTDDEDSATAPHGHQDDDERHQTSAKAAPASPTRAAAASASQAGPSSSGGPGDQQASDSSQATDDPTTSLTFSSIDLYRHYIQSMTPDLDAIRRERRMILNEFDNIKRMLSDMDA